VSRILIDTNIYSHAMKGTRDVIRVLQQADEIGICTVSIGELLSGFKAGQREKENRAELGEFLDAPRVRVYVIDEGTAEFYAELMTHWREAGRPIPTNDIWIGSVAMQHGLKLYSRDKHFHMIPGLIKV
jgi:predicted nucleic acid-binding protein